MLHFKKYFTEGLIQMAMLLSLCGVRVDMGLEPYLPPPWHEMILGPTSALTQTQFYNLRNHLGDDHDLHPKNIDLDGFFTTRRLLGWVRSLDRLQVGTHVHFSLHLKPMQMESEFCSSNRENIPRRLTLYSLDLTEVLTDPIVIPSLQSEQNPTLLPLTPSTELDDQSSALNSRDTLQNSNMNPSHSLPDHTHLLAQDPSKDFYLALNADENLSTLNMILPTEGLVDTLEGSAYSEVIKWSQSRPFIVTISDKIYNYLSFRSLLMSNSSKPYKTLDLTVTFPRFLLLDVAVEADSDSGLSLDFSRSPASPCASEAYSYSSSSTSSSSCMSAMGICSDMEVEVTIKQEELEDFRWLEYISHDHSYNQPWSSASSPSQSKMSTEPSFRDEKRARSRKIPFSNELIVNLPVEEFNDLLANYQLNEEQLTLVRDIRRRGKNKIAAQNCRKRKLNVLYDLEDSVSGLRRYRSRLLREKQEALKNLQERKRQLGVLYQDIFSRLRDDDGMPLSAMEYLLHFGSDGNISVVSHQQGAPQPLTKNTKKLRHKKK
uniref:Endoplasmic reticulum membrane sensor NFE2L1 n=1 Tax=Gasterosteus aculeatus aculeatus TaxID=481459 RepID=G3NQ39_GASAC